MAQALSVPGGTLAYDEAGQGRPVVLLHEGIADRRMWSRELPRIARHHQVAAYDLRGYGGSPPPTAPYSPLHDLAALIDHLRMDRPLLVGPSMGGRIALDFALAFPEKAGGLLLIAPGYSGMDYDHVPGGKATFERDERLSAAATAAFRAGKLDEATEHLRQLWASALTGDGLELFRRMVRDNAPEVFEDRSGRHAVFEGAPAAGRLGELRLPTRLLVGDCDNPAMPPAAKYLADRIPGAQLTIVPGADHLLNLSRPEAFDRALDELAACLGPGSA